MARRLLLTASTIAIAIAVNDQRALAGGGPMGGQVVAGQASITSPNANSTLITQSTQKAVINWQSFSIAQGSSVQFAQPNASAIALNRVIGSTPSNIDGSLFANGHVWLINGNGIIFGKGSQINVGSLIATTADMKDSDFMSGNYSFGMASANPNAAVQNSGTITVAKGGAAILAGATVSNDGLIRANMGQVTLASGSTFTVDFAGDNLLRFAVASPVTQTPKDANGNPKAALVSNSGTISAPGGQVTMTARAANDVVDNVINNTGMVEATSVSQKNGEIILDAGSGTAEAGGTLDASGTKSGETGGTVQILGNNVQVADGATINVSGHSGGGSVLVGGDLHGAGSLPHAQTTTVGKALITADATGSGNGGTVVAWSDGQTNFAASVSAKGGAEGGNGGQVETSGAHLHVDPTATVDTTAPKGTTGDWLLDPKRIVIFSDADNQTSLPSDGTLALATDSSKTDYVDPTTITNALATTDVTLEASNEIDVYNNIDYSSSHALNLLSEGDIYVAANVQNAGSGAINVIAGWDGTTTNPAHFTDAGVYGNNEGQVVISKDDDFDYGDGDEADEGEVGNVALGSAGGTTTVGGNFVYLQAQGGYAQIGYHGAGGGNINVLSTGDLEVGNDTGDGNYTQIGNGSVNGDVTGPVTGNIFVNVQGTTTLTDNTDGEGAPVWFGNVAGGASTETGNLTFVTGSLTGADIGPFVVADLGTSATTGGDVTIGQTAQDVKIDTQVAYSSPHALSILSTGSVTIGNTFENSGTGDVNVVAGWDGTTLDAAKFTNAGVYGNNGGNVVIGGEGTQSNSAVGSAGGTTIVAGNDVTLDAVNGYAQIGYAGGGGSGNIDVSATSAVTLSASSNGECHGCSAQIGHGGGSTDGGNNSGNITVNAGGDVSLTGGANDYSFAQIGNGGDSSSGDNSGNIGITAGGSVLLTGANDYAQIGNGGFGVEGNASGNVTVTATNDVSLTGGNSDGDFFGYAQIGNGGQNTDGAISGDLSVTAGGNTTLTSGALPNGNSNYVQIGNGAADGSTSGGNVSGDVSLTTAGMVSLDPSAGAQVWLGNLTDSEDLSSGNLTIVAGSMHGHGSNLISQIITGDLGISSDTGGNVTIGLTADNMGIDRNITFSSPHTLSLLSTGDVSIEAAIQNSGTGAINVVAGWDGHTLNPANFTDTGIGGNDGGTVTVGGGNAAGDSSLGSKGGATTVVGANVDVLGVNGYAQIGFHGDGGTGAITVIANGPKGEGNPSNDVSDCFSGGGNICVIGGSAESETDGPTYAQIGDLGQGVAGTASSNITVTANNNLSVAGGGIYHVANDPQVENAYGQIGNGDASVSTGQTVSGNIFVSVTGQTFLASSQGVNSPAWIGNRTSNLANQSGNVTFITGTAEGDDLAPMVIEDLGGLPGGAGGDVTVGSTAHDIQIDKTVEYSSPHTFNILSAGNVAIGNAVQNRGTGAINVVAGWNGTTLDPAHFTDAGVFGNNGGSVLIGGENAEHDSALGSAGGKTTVAGNNVVVDAENGAALLGFYGFGGGDIQVASVNAVGVTAATNEFAQIGNGGFELGVSDSLAHESLSGPSVGNITGNVTVNAGGPVSVSAGSLSDAQIGNGGAGVTGNVSGNVSVTSGNSVTVATTGGTSYAQIGNGGSVSADNVAPSGNVSGNVSVTAHGPVTLSANFASSGAHIGNGGVQAAGTISGGINVATNSGNVALTSGNGGGTLIGNVGGTGSSESGVINVSTPATLSLSTDTGHSSFALIGDGNDFTSNAQSDNVALSAHAITAANTAAVFANALSIDLTGTGGSVGSLAAPLRIDTTTLSVSGDAADAFLASLRSLSLGVGGNGIALDGGDLVLAANGDVTQTQTISANDVTITSSGAIQLNNAGNDVTGTLSLTGANDVSLANSVATTLGATSGNHVTVTTSGGGINVGGVVNGTSNVSLSAPGDITEAGGGSITGGGLVATSTGGGIALANAANSVTGAVKLSAHDDATFTNASAITLDTSNANNLTLTALAGGITLTGATTAAGNATFNAVSDITDASNGSLAVQDFTATSSGGAIAMTAPNNAVTGTVGLSAANDVAFANTVATTLGAVSGDHVTVSTTTGGIAVNGTVHGATNVNLNAPGDIAEGASGAITGGGLSATSTGGGIALGNSGNALTGTVQLSAHNDATFENASAITLGNSNANNLTLTALAGGLALNGTATATAGATLTAVGDVTEGGTLSAQTLNVTSTGGAVALTGNGNSIGTLQLTAHTDGTLYDNSSVTLASFSVGGNATVLSKGAITAPSSIQTPGNVTLVAGWDGTTTAPASLTNAGVYGNNSGNVTIGGAGASGNVAVGSTAGTTTVEGAGVQLAAVNGYAMIGGHGPATGSIVVNATGNVSLSGGANTNDFAQIGNGGQGISGNDSGAITVTAGGDVILSGGAGSEAYVQIGQGGAETNAGSNGYTYDSTINVHATNATLNGGTGSGAYAQVGQGGFKAGEDLAGGTATNSGNVSVIVTHAVALNGGGNDAYAQVGNGGDQSNMNAAASAHGLNTGNITVTAPNGPSGSVIMKAGNGTDAYADIGNGGFGANENTQAIPANFVNSGNVSVTDLTLQGGNGGANSFALIGNGGPGSVGNVSGNIAIDASGGKVIIIAGTATGSGSNIGNVTGDGTVTGSVTGFVSPTDAALNGTVNTSTNGTNTPKNLTNTNDVYIPPNNETSNDVVYSAAFLSTNDKGDNAIETLSGGDNEEETSSDTLTVTVANSLTKSKGSNSQTVIIGLLKQYTPLGSNTPHGVPPADQEYSSWGNEALWQ